VIHLLALLGLNIVSQGHYQGLGPIRILTLLAITVISGGAFVAFNAYVWAIAPTFGSQPDCNDSTIYVVFGVSIPATAPVFRWIIIATLSIIPVGILITLLFALPCLACFWWCRRRHHEGWVTTRHYNNPPQDPDSSKTKELVSTIALVVFSIYAIVSLEQTILRNNLDPAEKDRTFGQILAVFLLLGVANELLNLVSASLDRR
jgi:hypothetical protein